MCGVAAVSLADTKADTAAVELHESLYYLQHRGQDAAGIAVSQGGRIYQCKGNGMAASVFDNGARIGDLPGFQGVAHLRYPTAGTSSALEAQPFYVNSPFGLSMSINGNLVNSEELIDFLDREARRHVNTDSDSELLLNVFAHALSELGKNRANVEDIFTALGEVYRRCKGAFACTAMIAGFGIMGFRDENGIRPLCLGSRPSDTIEGAKDYFLASESVALRQLGFNDIVDILPGQAVFIEKGGNIQFCQVTKQKSYTPDVWEFFYFSRPDSIQDGISVHQCRERMGRMLGQKMKRVLTQKEIDEIDIIVPVPETSNTSAATLAQELQKPFSNAFVKCRYIHRTFILPGQKQRQSAVRRKLSPIASEFKGKVVCIVDDSLVRGTTSREIVQMARESGATRVLFASCSPEVKHPHVYGIDLADPAQLIASGKTPKEVARLINADEVIFQDLDDLTASCMEVANSTSGVTGFEVSVFTGKYQTEVPPNYFDRRAKAVETNAQQARNHKGGRGANAFLAVSSGPAAVNGRTYQLN